MYSKLLRLVFDFLILAQVALTHGWTSSLPFLREMAARHADACMHLACPGLLAAAALIVGTFEQSM